MTLLVDANTQVTTRGFTGFRGTLHSGRAIAQDARLAVEGVRG